MEERDFGEEDERGGLGDRFKEREMASRFFFSFSFFFWEKDSIVFFFFFF